MSPRNSCSVSIVFRLSETTELSSLTASSTTRRLGDFLRSRMAVLKSFLSFWLQAMPGPPGQAPAFSRFAGGTGPLLESLPRAGQPIQSDTSACCWAVSQ